MTPRAVPNSWIRLGLCLLLVMGCTDGGESVNRRFLIRVGDRQLSVSDFNRIFEISKTAYAHNDLQDPELLRDLKLRLLNQLLEELMLMEKAEDAGISVSDVELQAAVAQVTADYPKGVFEETLLETAISLEDWQERLRIRLLTRKVIDTVIAKNVVITPEDIQGYLKDHKADWPEGKSLEAVDEANAALLRRLRELKTERAYAAWMREQKNHYPVEIDALQWERLIK